ncbi:metal-dependent transcriptional regulator [Anoxynatronum buryatiense]|uniref:Manganese transport regulator n=1 Tax=Anoxynatronum buryatiense TaxID=489973 RepID=A0AA46AJV6_9CLOT|nr:metal-dependent transcriptional regulator [Anoxynatronum buryatiense]SMP63531.1 iron (metal) dependent repressor, DtxR family [Anoxynatronum buryatiense]
MNRGEEDYLKVLYELQSASDKPVSNATLALTLDHSVQSVNEMIKKLASKSHVVYTPYQGTRLTQSGIKAAVSLLRKHRLWEYFLHEKLHYSWEEIHEEAELLEHVTSARLEESLFDFLGRPAYCPHGNPIPTFEGHMPDLPLISLMEAEPGSSYKLVRVTDEQQVLAYLLEIGLKLGDKLQVVRKDNISDIITLKLQHEHIAIGFKVAKLLYVECFPKTKQSTLPDEQPQRMEDLT